MRAETTAHRELVDLGAVVVADRLLLGVETNASRNQRIAALTPNVIRHFESNNLNKSSETKRIDKESGRKFHVCSRKQKAQLHALNNNNIP